LDKFWTLHDNSTVRRTHFFHGRFENIYIELQNIPEILPLVAIAKQAAQEVLQYPGLLRCGFWFNLMGPGHCTSLHTHEEDDELLSAVYYLTVPEHSGDLVMIAEPLTLRLRPEAGMMALFPPSLPHLVETNSSAQSRLSVAFNFGPAD
jgi:hypothetical protein